MGNLAVQSERGNPLLEKIVQIGLAVLNQCIKPSQPLVGIDRLCLKHLNPRIDFDRFFCATIRGDSYRLRAKRKSGLIKAPAGDGPSVGSASLRSVTANHQPTP